MTNSDRDPSETSDTFERTLLDSAHLDSVSLEATERAWLRFSGSIATTALSAGGVRGATARNAAGHEFLSRLGPGKALLLGALGGSALTFAWLGAHRASPASPHAGAVLAAPGAAAVPTAASTSAGLPLVEGAPLRALSTRTRLASNAANAPKKPAALPSANQVGSTAIDDSEVVNKRSTLIAEVAALDAARMAMRAGAYDRALDLLGQYRTNFPAGVLRADAAVATMEAQFEKGDRAEASRLAAQFLAQFPNDPHSTTVRRLLNR